MKHIINNKINKGKRSLLCIMHYALCISMLFASCSDMLESDSSRQLFDPALDQKTDSVFYAYGVMQAMQQLADQYYFQNELRGDLVKPTDKASLHLRDLASFTADATNKYDSVYLYYKVINNCNYYLAHRDTTLWCATSMPPSPRSVHGPICSSPDSTVMCLTSPSLSPPLPRSMPTPR